MVISVGDESSQKHSADGEVFASRRLNSNAAADQNDFGVDREGTPAK